MNQTERSFAALMTSHGYYVSRNGWPDFLVLTPDKKDFFAVEVKYGDDPLNEDQERMTRLLAGYGVKVFVVRAPYTSTTRKVMALAGGRRDARDL